MDGSSYPTGVDCAWLASDSDNRLAVFITAGCGPVPVGLLRLLSGDDGDLEPLIYKLPVVSEARLSEEISYARSFVEFAQRGLYAYDWSDVHRPAVACRNAYELVATPVSPINVDMLSGELARHAQELRLVACRFGEAQFLDVCQGLVCRSPE